MKYGTPNVALLLTWTINTSVGNYTLQLSSALRNIGINRRVIFLRAVTAGSSRWDDENIALANEKRLMTTFTIPHIGMTSLKPLDMFSGHINFKLRRIFQSAIMQKNELHRFDLYHYLTADLDPREQPLDKPRILTSHDMTPFIISPNESELETINKRYMARTFSKLIKEYDLLIAVSNTTKQAIHRLFGYPESRIRVVHLGVDHSIFKPRPGRRDGNYILNISTDEEKHRNPRKNRDFLLHVFREASTRMSEIKLVCVGYGKRDLELSRTLGIQNRIIFLRDLTQAQIVRLYQNARLYVHPALYEGFGLTLLEAMACACPVITHNYSAMPEVVGSAGTLLGRMDVEEWTNACLEPLADKRIWREMSDASHQRSLEFSWKKCARETSEVYREVLNTH
jgi:alpha-1,3-rhamnosyl/mannosyltransferase